MTLVARRPGTAQASGGQPLPREGAAAQRRDPRDDPSVDLRDEIAIAGGMPELPNKIWFHKTAGAVIDADRCVGCGGCIAACPSRSIGVADDGRPTLVKMCTGCSACWDYCPLAGLNVEALHAPANGNQPVTGSVATGGTALCASSAATSSQLGTIDAAYSASGAAGTTHAQDGGVVTTLLCSLLASGFIDAAIVTKHLDAFHGEPFLARTVDEVRSAAGSVYHQGHPLKVLNEPLPKGVERIAFVGTPCQISVLRALQRFPWRYRRSAADGVMLAIGLFCTRSFEPTRLEKAVADAGVEPSAVHKVDVRDGELVLHGQYGELLRRPVRDFHAASLKGCDECADFAGLGADLALGSLASDQGNTTVLVRTAAGREAWAAASGALDTELLDDPSPLVRTATRNRRRAVRALERRYDPRGPLWTSYTEHLDLYGTSDRAVQAPKAFRSQHFEVTC